MCILRQQKTAQPRIFRQRDDIGHQSFSKALMSVSLIDDYIGEVVGSCEITDYPGKPDQFLFIVKVDTIAG